jgi:hypothetical protein
LTRWKARWHDLGIMRLSFAYRRLRRWFAKPENWWLPAMISDVSKKFKISAWVYWSALAAPFFWPIGDICFHGGDFAFFSVMVPGLSICLFHETVSELGRWIGANAVPLGLVVTAVLMRLADPFHAARLSADVCTQLVTLQPTPPLVRKIPSVCLSNRLLPVPLAIARQAGG